MATEIAIRRPTDERLEDMEKWCRENIGLGSFRTIKNSFMGMDDWFYYDNIPDFSEGDEELEVDQFDDDYNGPDVVFAFRREADATIFALKWSTATF